MMGSARVAKAAPDGYQFVLGSRADAINQTLYKTPLYSLTSDLEPVVLVARPARRDGGAQDLPVNGLQEFIAYAKDQPGQDAVRLGGCGFHGFHRLRAVQRGDASPSRTCRYRGGGPAMQDLMGGRIDYFCTSPARRCRRSRARDQGGRRDDA